MNKTVMKRMNVLSVTLGLIIHAFCYQTHAADEIRKSVESDFCRSLQYAGIAIEEKGWHIWGCSPVIGKDGKVHAFVERFPTSVPFDIGWRTHSEIAHYVADAPEGPFTFRETVLKGTGENTWDRFGPHNSHIQEIDGKYVLLYIANANGMTKGIAGHTSSQRIGMAIAETLDGPWRKVGDSGLILSPSTDPKHWTFHASNGVNNPALLKHPSGKYCIYYKSQAAKMGVAISDKLEGPYIHQPEPITQNKTAIEDGYAFMSQGKFYFLTTDNHGICEKGGGLLWESADGLSFEQTPQLGFHAATHYLPLHDSQNVRHHYAARTCQRPQILMQSGQPTHLYVASGTNPNGGDGTVSMVLKCEGSQIPSEQAHPTKAP